MFGSWVVIGGRMHKAGGKASKQIVSLHRFFLYIGIFSLLMFLPNLWLTFAPADFPLVMAIGYTVGHIFLFIAATEIGRLFVSMVPRLVNWDKGVLTFGIVVNIAATITTAVTMIFGVQPQYDYQEHVILFNAATPVGIFIAGFMIVTVLPPTILFLADGIRNSAHRLRSFLLGIGFILMIAGGPLHDNATSASMYVAADILTIAAVILVAAGVLYRYEERLAPAARLKSAHSTR
jgi:hypothetical protein